MLMPRLEYYLARNYILNVFEKHYWWTPRTLNETLFCLVSFLERDFSSLKGLTSWLYTLTLTIGTPPTSWKYCSKNNSIQSSGIKPRSPHVVENSFKNFRRNLIVLFSFFSIFFYLILFFAQIFVIVICWIQIRKTPPQDKTLFVNDILR